MTRSQARSLQGQRAVVKEPFRSEVNLSVIGALSIDGIFAPMTIEGSMDSAAFDMYVEHFLIRELYPGDIVILDNVPFHLSLKAVNLIIDAGANVLYLPPYCPDLNPIELCISKIKALLRKAKATSKPQLLKALVSAFNQVSLLDISGWFAHAGYSCLSN